MSDRYVSNSELKTFKECHRKWYFAYWRNLVGRRPVVGPLAVGTRVHLALATMYSTEGGDPLEVLRESIESDRPLLPDGDEDAAKKFKSEADLAYAMVEGYLEWVEETGADEFLEIIGDEEPVAVPFTLQNGSVVILVGRLDVKVRRVDDGAIRFIDHKTAATLNVPGLQLDEQMLMYELMQKLQHPEERVVGGIYNMLRKVKRTATAKPPFFKREEILHNDEELRNFWWRLQGEITDMLAVENALNDGADHHVVAYANPTRDCSWKCEFFNVCPMMDDGSHVEPLLDSFEVKDPYDRRYADVVAENTGRA